jgi:two-component system LytT family response regulator
MKPKIKSIIIDDEKLARDVIKNYIKSFSNVEIAAECSDGFEGLKSINEIKPDIIFLDIQMPKINGFEMLELIDEPPKIIFTTAFDQYALKAFEVNAIDYLLKPFSKERFAEACNKAINNLQNNASQSDQVKNLLIHHEREIELLDRVIIKKGANIKIIPVDEIEYIEAQDDYVMLHTKQGKFLKQKTMKFFESHLDPKEYIRIHRSYIVKLSSIKQIEGYEKDSYRIELKNGIKLPVSKSGYSKLKEFLK